MENKINDFLYVYIDESGDLGKYGSRYFTISAIAVSDPLILKRIIKKVRERKLKKKIKQLPELKANNSDRLTKEFILNKVGKIDCSIFAVVVEKKDIIDDLYNIKNRLYNYVCGILMERVHFPKYKITMVIDKKHTNTLMRDDFNNYIKNKIMTKNKDLKIDISHKESHALNELQVIDFVAWSINRKFNSNDDYYYKLIEHKIINKDTMRLWQ